MAQPTDLPLFNLSDAALGNIAATAALYSLLIEQHVIEKQHAQDVVRKTCVWLEGTDRKDAAAFIRAHFRVLLES